MKLLSQMWYAIQGNLFPLLEEECGIMMKKHLNFTDIERDAAGRQSQKQTSARGLKRNRRAGMDRGFNVSCWN